MPTHNDLLDAEVAFILYDGQVYMTHPTDRDVSLTNLIGQMDDLGYIDTPLVQSIQAFLRGEEAAPKGLGLVGRYHMSNGRMAPYGPINSPENQELVRQTIQQSLYSAPQTPQEPVSGDPARGMAPTVSQWRFGREFMPHVEKVGPGECPLCSQKRTLYHPRDHYKAQAMGIYGVGLCRDCLTTRMDQHEYLMGERISKIMAEGADVKELANRKRMQLLPQIEKLEETDPHAGTVTRRMLFTVPIPDEFFKLYDWVFAQVKRGEIDMDNMAEAHDFISYELGPLLALLKEKNKPWPDLKSKAFDIDSAESWVNEPANYKLLEQAGMGVDKAGPYGNEDDPIVHTFDDGYTLRSLEPNNTQTEGIEMGNCIQDNDEYHWSDKIADGYIYILSLRDQRNRPHVSWAVDREDFDQGNLTSLQGPYGKENKPPIEKYQKYLDEYMAKIKEEGGQITQGLQTYDEQYEEQQEAQHDPDSDEIDWSNFMTIDSVEQLENFWIDFSRNPHEAYGVGPDPYTDAEPHYEDGYGGVEYYYYKIDAGTEIEATERDLKEVVDDIYSYIHETFDVPPRGSPPPDEEEENQSAIREAEQMRTFASAMVAASYLSAAHGYRSNATRIGLNLAQYALDLHNDMKDVGQVVPQAFSVSAFLIKCLETLGTKNFSNLDYPGKEASGNAAIGNNLAEYFTYPIEDLPFEPEAQNPRDHDIPEPKGKGYQEMVPAENRPTTEWTSESSRANVLRWIGFELGNSYALDVPRAVHDRLVNEMTYKFAVTPAEAEDAIQEFIWNNTNPGGYKEDVILPGQKTVADLEVGDRFEMPQHGYGRVYDVVREGWAESTDGVMNIDLSRGAIQGIPIKMVDRDIIQVGDTPRNPADVGVNPQPIAPGLEIHGLHPTIVSKGVIVVAELDSTTQNGQPYPENAKRGLFVTKMRRWVGEAFDPPQNELSNADAIRLYEEIRAQTGQPANLAPGHVAPRQQLQPNVIIPGTWIPQTPTTEPYVAYRKGNGEFAVVRSGTGDVVWQGMTALDASTHARFLNSTHENEHGTLASWRLQ